MIFSIRGSFDLGMLILVSSIILHYESNYFNRTKNSDNPQPKSACQSTDLVDTLCIIKE